MQISSRSRTAIFVSVGMSMSVAGCSSIPEVKYAESTPNKVVNASDINNVTNTYDLWTTSLEFKKDSNAAMSLSIAAVPVSSNPTTLSITGQDHWYKTTTAITLATAPDSNLLASVNVIVTDNRATYISTAAELLATVLPLVAAAPSPPAPPSCSTSASIPVVPVISSFDEVVNLFDLVQVVDQQFSCSSRGMPMSFVVSNNSDGVGDLAIVSIEPPPASAVEFKSHSAELLKNAVNVFLYPACRQATVTYVGAGPVTAAASPSGNNNARDKATLSKDGNADAPQPPATPTAVSKKVSFLFSDPRYVQAIPLPVKGTLTVKNQCGMSAGTDSGTVDSTAAIAKAIADGIQSIASKTSKTGSSAATPKTNATGK